MVWQKTRSLQSLSSSSQGDLEIGDPSCWQASSISQLGIFWCLVHLVPGTCDVLFLSFSHYGSIARKTECLKQKEHRCPSGFLSSHLAMLQTMASVARRPAWHGAWASFHWAHLRGNSSLSSHLGLLLRILVFLKGYVCCER